MIDAKTYYKVTGLLFLVIAAVHLLRLIQKWPAMIGTYTLPVWLSWLAFFLALYLAANGLKHASKI